MSAKRKKAEPEPDVHSDSLGGDDPAFEDLADADRTPVAGVGASAGGLEAFSELLEQLPSNPGLAIALIQHLEPTHHSDLAEILGRKTSMPVLQVENGMQVQADHVYVIPPNTEMRMSGDTFRLDPRPSGSAPSLTVDIFLTSLAEQCGNRAIGVVLSGTASDGTKGLAAIKAGGGITLVQSPETARQSGMPESAVAAGVADAVLQIDGIARELVRLAALPYTRYVEKDGAKEPVSLSAEDERALQEIVSRVRQLTGLDLGHYKRPTLLRRIERRMAMKRTVNMSEYLAVMDRDTDEIAELLADALVRVTAFFRDPEAFEALKAQALPSILERKSAEDTVRIWVPGCATGQEAYSIAIVAFEHLEAMNSGVRVQVFASDLRESDLAFARRGVYPEDIASEVRADRLDRFFTPVEGGHQICKTIRETCIFAHHDVTSDPPFAHLDLVSCRNLLIYLDNSMQKRLLGVFHYALVPDGVLMLGESEGTAAASGLFKRTEHKCIFSRLPGDTPRFAFGDHAASPRQAFADHSPLEAFESARGREWSDAQRQLDEMLLNRYAPAALLIDEDLQIKQVRGAAGEYLRFRPGEATLDLAAVVSASFSMAIASAVEEVRETEQIARRETVQPRAEGGHSAVDIVVIPMPSLDAPTHYAVLFNEGASLSRSPGEPGAEPTEVEYLRQELDAATERLRILHYGRDAANESLRAANEEIQSANEELQSMNEELETAKEELQSTNEELVTLNEELRDRAAELGHRNDDLNNLLSSAAIAMLLLDADLSIRRYTLQAARAFNLIPGDIGRRVTDLRWRLVIEGVEEMLTAVMESGQPDERRVTDDSGHTYRMITRPYLTSENGIRGAVITLLDADTLPETAGCD